MQEVKSFTRSPASGKWLSLNFAGCQSNGFNHNAELLPGSERGFWLTGFPILTGRSTLLPTGH